jgi:DNA-binding transcriptional regulator LsrR (DeoR family)
MTETSLLYKIAKAYYEDGLTQDQIGKRFGLSRIKISRLLQQARQTRVVQISITPPAGSFGDLERELEQVFGLDEVVVVGVNGSADGSEYPSENGLSQADVLPRLGNAAAAYLARVLGDQHLVAISWGTTLLATVDALAPQHLPEVRVVQMLGGLGRLDAETYGSELTLRLAQTLGAKMRLLPAPGIVASKLVRDALLQDIHIAETLEMAARADIAVVGLGAPVPGAVVMQTGILTAQDVDELHAAGAVGDIALRFFDAAGTAVAHPINDRIVGLDLDQIRSIPRVIGVAGGRGKLPVILGALRGRLIEVLITDEVTAHQLLTETRSPSVTHRVGAFSVAT